MECPEIVVKSGKRLATVWNTITELKGRPMKIYKSSITFCLKAISQPKNKQKSPAVTQSVGITDLEITLILL